MVFNYNSHISRSAYHSSSKYRKRPNYKSGYGSAPAQYYHHQPPAQLDTPYKVGKGLVNLGNSCFLNSVLQCLVHTPELLAALLGHQKACTRRNSCPVCELSQLIRTVYDQKSPAAPFAPRGMVSLIRSWSGKPSCSLRVGCQEDAHEYLRFELHAVSRSKGAAPQKTLRC